MDVTCAVGRPLRMQRATRMKKELQRLQTDPPHGVSCWPKDGRLDHLEAQLLGAKDTPFEGGIFRLEIKIPERYPFEPPQVQLLTRIYHPNVDTAGRICLDVLKSPPQGTWKPAHNISTVLTSIQLLLAEPNPDDGLMADISHEYKHNRPSFIEKAKEWVKQYAKEEYRKRPTQQREVGEGDTNIPTGNKIVEEECEKKPTNNSEHKQTQVFGGGNNGSRKRAAQNMGEEDGPKAKHTRGGSDT